MTVDESIGLVTHEVTHAALHIYGLVHDLHKLNTIDGIDAGDEPLAYLVGDLTSKLYKQLYKRDLIK